MTQVAVITGAAQGIGRRTAQVLNEHGWSLVLLDLQHVDASEYKSALALAGDISDEHFVESAALQCIDKFGRVDALVNNAGISCISSALETSADLYRKVIDVNLVAPFLLAKAFGRVMIANGSGSVVNVASVAGLQGVADRSAYNASKHGLIGLTRTLAVEWGAKGVRVNAVAPGFIQTPILASMPEDVLKGMEARVPLKRLGRAEEIANVYAFLASDEASYINGAVIEVSGGLTV